MKKLRILLVAGARPNFVKAASLLRAGRKHPLAQVFFLHTGQHFDREMSQLLLEELDLPKPDYQLGGGRLSECATIAEIMRRFELVASKVRPDVVVVVGDVNSTLASALAAKKLHIPVAHVEAGLRSFDPTMPEETNRRLTDALSDFLFVTEDSAVRNLVSEGIDRQRIFHVGNVMVDTLLQYLGKSRKSTILRDLSLELPENGEAGDVTRRNGMRTLPYAVLTLHRPSNVDDPAVLKRILEGVSAIALQLPVIFPIHPRTRARIEALGLQSRLSSKPPSMSKAPKGLFAIPPIGYLEFIKLISHASFVLTDSGGIQEETTVLGVPCLTLRWNTERPATVLAGNNKVIGTDPRRIILEADALMRKKNRIARVPRLWDGRAADRIMQILLRQVLKSNCSAVRKDTRASGKSRGVCLGPP